MCFWTLKESLCKLICCLFCSFQNVLFTIKYWLSMQVHRCSKSIQPNVIHPSLIQVVSCRRPRLFVERTSFSRMTPLCDRDIGVLASFRLTRLASPVANYIPDQVLDKPLPFRCSKLTIMVLYLLLLAKDNRI